MNEARALVKLAGDALRIALQVAALTKVARPLAIDIRRSVAAVQEELGLLRHFIRQATLEAFVDGPRHHIRQVSARIPLCELCRPHQRQRKGREAHAAS
jgi:hypothetical protein